MVAWHSLEIFWGGEEPPMNDYMLGPFHSLQFQIVRSLLVEMKLRWNLPHLFNINAIVSASSCQSKGSKTEVYIYIHIISPYIYDGNSCAQSYNSLRVQWKYQDKPGTYVELDVMRKPRTYWNAKLNMNTNKYISYNVYRVETLSQSFNDLLSIMSRYELNLICVQISSSPLVASLPACPAGTR